MKSLCPRSNFPSLSRVLFARNSSGKNINMSVLPHEPISGTGSYSIPDEAHLKGFKLVSRRAANMVYTVFGEKAMTKMLQVGGCTGFVDALGKVWSLCCCAAVLISTAIVNYFALFL